MIRQIYEIINIFSASLPYIAQIKKFQETKSSEGYSMKVSLCVITSCILKIYFWFGKFYHWSLLLQAILLTITHLWLVYEAVKFKNINQFKLNEPKTFDENIEFINTVSLNSEEGLFNFSKFFNWNQIQLYAILIFIYTYILGCLSELLGFQDYFFIESMGIINIFIEGALAIPQVLEISKTKNVDNISVVLIACWFIGDLLKTYYFFVSGSPFQFSILGMIQVSLNCVIVYQYFLYKK